MSFFAGLVPILCQIYYTEQLMGFNLGLSAVGSGYFDSKTSYVVLACLDSVAATLLS